MIFTVNTHAHRSDLDSKSILSGESSVRELVSVYNPGVTKNLITTQGNLFPDAFSMVLYKKIQKDNIHTVYTVICKIFNSVKVSRQQIANGQYYSKDYHSINCHLTD